MSSKFSSAVLCVFVSGLLLSSLVSAQTFPVRLERAGTNGVCDNMTANRMAVDPLTGRVTLQGVTGMTCLPDGAAGLGNVGISVPGGPHPSGVAAVTATVQNIPAGATCTLRGSTDIQGNGVIGGDGWSEGSLLCSACPTSVTRTLALTNVSTTVNWVLQLNLQCSIQSGGYAVQAPIVTSNQITVLPATVVEGSCPFGEQVPPINHDGLTSLNRQTTTQVSNGYQGPGLKDATLWTSLFGVTTGGWIAGVTLASPGPSNQGYGFPGTHGNQTYFRMNRGQFIAMKFRAPAAGTNWTSVRANLNFYSADSPSSQATFSIAPCPGQFGRCLGLTAVACVTNNPKARRARWDSSSLIEHSYTGEQCALEQGKTYYWNIMAINQAQSLQNSLCVATTCNYRMAGCRSRSIPTIHK